MRKKVKGLLAAGIVLCVAGAGLFALGAGMGGLAYVGEADLNSMDADAGTKTAAMEKTKIEGFHRIEAELQDIDLKILPSGDQNYYLSYGIFQTESDDPLEYRVENDTLVLSGNPQNHKFIQIDISYLSYLLGGSETPYKDNEVVLYVPENTVLEDSRIKLDDGDLEASDLSCLDVEMQFRYGSLSLGHTSVENCVIELSDGDLEAENLMVQGSLEIENSYGDVELQLEEACRDVLSMDLKTKYGEIDVSEDLEKAGYLTEKDDQAGYKKTSGSSDGVLKIESSDGDIILE